MKEQVSNQLLLESNLKTTVHGAEAAPAMARSSAASSSSSPQKISQRVDVNEAAHFLGMTNAGHQAVLHVLFNAAPSEREEKIEELSDKVQRNLGKAGLEGTILKTEKGTLKYGVAQFMYLLGTGAVKAAYKIIKFSGKAAGICKKKVAYDYVQTNSQPPLEAFQIDVEQSVKYSKILSKKGGKHFLNYKEVSFVSKESGETQTTMMAQYCDGGDLLGKVSTLTSDEKAQYMRDLADAGRIMEEEGIIHRDLKLENLFLITDITEESNERVVIGDFGFMAGSSDSIEKIQGTPGYVPPITDEPLEDWTKKQDSYALGMVFLEIATQRHFCAFRWIPRGEFYHRTADIVKLREKLMGMPNNPLATLIAGLLDENYKTRLTITDAALLFQQIADEELKRCNEELFNECKGPKFFE